MEKLRTMELFYYCIKNGSISMKDNIEYHNLLKTLASDEREELQKLLKCSINEIYNPNPLEFLQD